MKQKKTKKIVPLDTAELKSRIRILHTKGLTSDEIAVNCNMSVGLVREILKELGYKDNFKQKKEKHIWADSCHYRDEELQKKYGD